MVQHGLYMIKDEFFEKMGDPYLKDNKEGQRPHYYCLWDDKDEVYWMIPLSSQISKYQNIINNRIAKRKPCDILHIAEMPDGKQSVFLIQDMFPVTSEYIDREYTLGGNHLVLVKAHIVSVIDQKARKVLQLLKQGYKFTPTQPDVMAILAKLKS